jgi:transposase InsO family protein
VTTTCEVLGFSSQAFYQWQARPVSDRDWTDAHTINAIIDGHADDPEFGYRFIADELEAVGDPSCERRVWRLCSQQRIWSTTTKQGRKSHGRHRGRRCTTTSCSACSAPTPDVLWLTDITEHPTLGGKLYCCSMKDVFSNRIVGYAFGPRMTAQLAVRALRSAIAHRRPKGTVVVHPDRGGQFRSRAFRAALKANGLVGSMGRVAAAAADNAAMELVLRVAAEERAEPTASLAHPRRTYQRAHHLDRTHLQPTPPPTPTRETHPYRLRARLDITTVPRRQ